MPINKRNPGLAPSPSRGGTRASSDVEKGIGPMRAATNNRPGGENRSNAAYNRANKKLNAPTSKRDAYRTSEAHENSSLKGIGGNHGGAIDDPTPPKIGGLDSGRGRDSHHGSAKAKENIRPNSAHEYSSFGNIGGSVKSNV